MILRALSALWTSFAPPMANHLWQSTLFVALAAILAFALRTNQGRVRYWVWLTASLKFLLPFSLLIALGSHLAKPSATTPAQTVVYSAVEDFSQPFAAPEMPTLSPAAPAPVSPLRLLPPILVAAWLAGIVVVLLVWATSWIRVFLMVRRAVPLRQGPEIEALRRLESNFGVPKPIRLVLSQNWMEPGIFGIFRPVLIWPEGISQHLDDKHIDAILAHEICHARRRDNLTAMLHMLVEAVFWFHPLVWWMGARLEEERERACDEEVSLLCHQPHVYAESILRVCKFCSESPLACVSGITGADLKKRIVQIMTPSIARKLDLRRKLLLLAVAAVVVAAPLALGLAHRPLVFAQILHASGPLPSFEVSTVRPFKGSVGPPPLPGPGAPPPPRQASGGADFHAIEPAKYLIGSAYNIPMSFLDARILGGPEWIDTDSYEIRGKIEESMKVAMDKMPREQRHQQIELMEQSLLANQFKLKVHFETRELPEYALVVAKGGPKLTPVKALPDDTVNPPISSQGWRLSDFKKGMLFLPKGQGTEMTARSVTLDELVHEPLIVMNPAMDGRVVVNQTGLSGTYDFTLRFGREQSATSGTEDVADDAPPLRTALQEQLGLKLVPTKGPVEVIVIDHIEKPTVDGAGVMPPARVVPAAQVQEVSVQGQAAQNSPSSCPDARGLFAAYDVVSVRPTNATPRFVGLQEQPDGISGETVTVAMMVQQAYSASMVPTDDAVARLPDWAKMPTYFSVQAKLNPEQVAALASLSKDQQKGCRVRMLQALLADRFKLQVHHETRQVPTYDLVVANGGPKMKELTASDPNVFVGSNGKPMLKNSMRIVPSNGGQELVIQNFSIDQLAAVLAGTGGVDHRVVNKTGLAGIYSYTLTFAMSRGVGPAGGPSEPVASDPGPTVFQALEDQLGLKLQRGIDTVDVVVADHVERPVAN